MRAYCHAAMDVPINDGILVVPNKVATGYLGKVINVAGVCIKPPPPTMASMKPAANAAKQSKIISCGITACNFFLQIANCQFEPYYCPLRVQFHNHRSCPCLEWRIENWVFY